MPYTDLSQASMLAEKLRTAIADETIPIVGHKTSSFGVTSYILGESLTTLLARADEALYKAKNSGRNCVQTLGESPRVAQYIIPSVNQKLS